MKVNKKDNFILSLVVNCFFALSIVFLGPLEIFAANTTDFEFSIIDFWWILFIVAFLFIVFASIIMVLVPEKVRKLMAWGVFSFSLCAYVQTMFMNGKMQVMIGQTITWSTELKILNLIIWILICVVTLFLITKTKQWRKLILYTSICVLLLQITSVVTTFISTQALKENKSGYMSKDHMFDLSKNKNVVVFLLDYFDGRVMEEILENEPDFLEPLDGFTYYPNATSMHSRTYPSIAYLFTGNKCYFDKKPDDYVKEAYDNSTFLNEMAKSNTNIGVYSYKEYFSHSARAMLCNYYREKGTINVEPLLKYMAKMVLYRDMPYIAKNRFKYDAETINAEALCVSGDNKYQPLRDSWFYDDLVAADIRDEFTNNCFRFYHLGSCHLNFDDMPSAGKYAMQIVYDYISRMKQMGIYENSTIILIADHGFSGEGDTLDMPHKTAVPLIIVKEAGNYGTPISISNAPVSQEEFIPTVLDGLGIEHDQRVFSDIKEDEKRDRYYYYSAMYSNEEGEIELREYKVDGDARIPESYKFTGNSWDIKYSQNKVKK